MILFRAFLPFMFPLARKGEMRNAARVAQKRKSRPAWKNWMEYAFFRGFEFVFGLFPPACIDWAGRKIGSWAWHLAKKRRETVIRNCKIAWGEELDQVGLENLSRSIFSTCGANLFGGMRSSLMTDEQIRRHVTMEGVDCLKKSLTENPNGVNFALAHMGNWEILARLGVLIIPGVPCGAFYRPLNNPLINRLVAKRRNSSGTQLFSSKKGFIKACALLRGGGVLGMLCDQHAGGSGELSTFFGRITPCSPLPALLQRRTGAAVFHAAVIRTSPAHWKVILTPQPLSEDAGTPSIMKGLEHTLSLSPADGFWLHDRWKLPTTKPLSLINRRGDLGIAAKPYQILLVLSRDEKIRNASIPALQYLIEQRTDLRFFLLGKADELIAAHVTRVANPDNTGVVPFCDDLSRSNPLPLDIALIADAPVVSSRRSTVPIVAGLGGADSSWLTHRLSAGDHDPQDPATWFALVAKIGCPAAVPEETPSLP